MSHLVFSGGGLKGLAYIGLIQALEELNMIKNIKSISGTSIGAIFAVMLSIGYKYQELYDFIEHFDYNDVSDIKITRLLDQCGIETGSKISHLLQVMIKKKMNGTGKMTFKEHYEKTGIWIVINAVCLNTQSCVYFSYKTHPNMPLWFAMRMSISLPFWFNPVKYKNMYYIDGGLIDNFPIEPFKELPKEEIIGIKLQKHNLTGQFNHIDLNMINYAGSIWGCIYNEINKNLMLKCEQQGYNFFCIVNKNYSAFTPDISLENKINLYDEGYQLSLENLNNYITNTIQSVLEDTIQKINI